MSKTLRAVVTGAASGIGKAVYEAFEKQDYKVVGIDINPEGNLIVADLSTSAGRKLAYESAIKQLGGIDVLVNAAGIFMSTPINASGMADFQKVLSINLEAPIELSALVFESMKAQSFGRIVNITSIHSQYAKADCLAYDVSKAGLEAATRSMAVTGAAFGVLANAIAPGYVRTAMSLNQDGVDESDTAEFAKDYIASGRLPLGRAATAQEIAEAVCWLAGSTNTYITGQVLIADGGLSATF
jgi:NAD(P)-dependent dehydrogenase (short-subunit alcohol dehydrogenase family)